MKYYGTDINIEDVQKVQLEILIEFDRICKKMTLYVSYDYSHGIGPAVPSF